MRRKTQIVLAITFMVAALVCGFSYIYVSADIAPADHIRA